MVTKVRVIDLDRREQKLMKISIDALSSGNASAGLEINRLTTCQTTCNAAAESNACTDTKVCHEETFVGSVRVPAGTCIQYVSGLCLNGITLSQRTSQSTERKLSC